MDEFIDLEHWQNNVNFYDMLPLILRLNTVRKLDFSVTLCSDTSRAGPMPAGDHGKPGQRCWLFNAEVNGVIFLSSQPQYSFGGL